MFIICYYVYFVKYLSCWHVYGTIIHNNLFSKYSISCYKKHHFYSI